MGWWEPPPLLSEETCGGDKPRPRLEVNDGPSPESLEPSDLSGGRALSVGNRLCLWFLWYNVMGLVCVYCSIEENNYLFYPSIITQNNLPTCRAHGSEIVSGSAS